MSGLGFDFLPKVLDRIVVWRIGRQWVDGEAFFVLFEKFTSGFAGMVASAVLNEDDRAGHLRKQIEQKGLVTVTVETAIPLAYTGEVAVIVLFVAEAISPIGTALDSLLFADSCVPS